MTLNTLNVQKLDTPSVVCRALCVAALVCALQGPARARAESASAPAPTGPTYMELGHGDTQLWFDLAAAGHWFTPRAPLASTAPWGFGVALAHRIGPVRVGGRADALVDPRDWALAFLAVDFVAVERVYRLETAVRPFWRLALGFGLDLVGARKSLGAEGYFNAANGSAAGVSVAHAWGLELFVGPRVFVRPELGVRAHTGAGRGGFLTEGRLGVGVVL